MMTGMLLLGVLHNFDSSLLLACVLGERNFLLLDDIYTAMSFLAFLGN